MKNGFVFPGSHKQHFKHVAALFADSAKHDTLGDYEKERLCEAIIAALETAGMVNLLENTISSNHQESVPRQNPALTARFEP